MVKADFFHMNPLVCNNPIKKIKAQGDKKAKIYTLTSRLIYTRASSLTSPTPRKSSPE